MWSNWRKCYPLKLELIPIALVFFSFYIALSNYSALPDSIPIHFDAMGNPDSSGRKGWVILVPIISAANFLGLTLINFLFAIVEDPRHFINLPRGRSAMDILTREQGEAVRVSINHSIFALKIVTLSLEAYLAWQMVEIGLGRSSSMGPWLWFFAGAILIICIYMVWKSIRLTRTPA